MRTTNVLLVGNSIVLESSQKLERWKEPILQFLLPKGGPKVTGQEYLLGLRGFLVIQSFVWVFLETFMPAAVKDAPNADGPPYQLVLRKLLSVLFWNGSLLYSFFIFLSARTLCVPFFADPRKSVVASAVFRRGLRLWWPVAVSLALTTLTFSQTGVGYIGEFMMATHNLSIAQPYFLANPVIYLNSVFNVFWTTIAFSTQSGNLAFPGQTLWAISLIYNQSFTVFMVMVAVPYTRAAWRLQMGTAFVLSAWWVQSWAWYSVSGMLLADAVMHMDFRTHAARGIKLWRLQRRLPMWIPGVALLAFGLALQYVWTAARPDMANAELTIHAPLYSSDELNWAYDAREPQARDDNYLVIVGFFLLLETLGPMRAIFGNPFFVYLGKRSLSWFLIQSLVVYTCGIKLFMHMQASTAVSFEAIVAACFFACLPATALFAELFHRMIDFPSQNFAHMVFNWITD